MVACLVKTIGGLPDKDDTWRARRPVARQGGSVMATAVATEWGGVAGGGLIGVGRVDYIK